MTSIPVRPEPVEPKASKHPFVLSLSSQKPASIRSHWACRAESQRASVRPELVEGHLSARGAVRQAHHERPLSHPLPQWRGVAVRHRGGI